MDKIAIKKACLIEGCNKEAKTLSGLCRFHYQKQWRKNHKEERRAYHLKYYAENKESLLNYHVGHYKENKQSIIDYQNKYRKENGEKISNRTKKYYIKNREELLSYQKKYQGQNKEKIEKRFKKYYKKNEEKIKANVKKYAKNNKELVRASSKRYREKNREKINDYERRRYQKNKDKMRVQQRKYLAKRRQEPKFRLDSNMSTAVYRALKGNKNWNRWQILVGYTLNELMKHLEGQFDENMAWNNYGSYWAVDHTLPLYCYKYEKPEDKQFKLAWSLKNLRPLEKIENIRKSNKLVLLNDF